MALFITMYAYTDCIIDPFLSIGSYIYDTCFTRFQEPRINVIVCLYSLKVYFIIQKAAKPLCIHEHIYIQDKYNYKSINLLHTRWIANQNNVCFFQFSKHFILGIDTFLISVSFFVVVSTIFPKHTIWYIFLINLLHFYYTKDIQVNTSNENHTYIFPLTINDKQYYYHQYSYT